MNLQDQGRPTETLTGVLERITFQNEKNGYTVARLTEKGPGDEPKTIVGALAGVAVGTTLEVEGWWYRDPRHGIQFHVRSYRIAKPNTLRGIEKYLGSGLIKGIGPHYANRIVKHFGLDTLDILDKNPDRLTEVPGLGEKRAEKIMQAWSEQRSIHNIMIFLQSHSISASYAVKIFKTYGTASLTVVQENPYKLAEDIWGIGFRSADRIALAMGLPLHDDRRARAGILHVLNQAAEEGHCFLPLAELVNSGETLLEIPVHIIDRQIPSLVMEEKLVVDEDSVYLPSLYFAEKGTARRLMEIALGPPLHDGIRISSAIEWASRWMGISFAPEQVEAIEGAIRNKATVITGGPGTGKSTILKALILILEQKNALLRLAAPTGRAAKRLAEATGRDARTLHRLLEYDPSRHGFKRNQDNPLEGDVIIVDEASMLDIALANSLFKATPPSSSLVLVGDVDQLPSVGPGNVLRDIIGSGRLPVTRLQRIFRQGEGSLISLNAARINKGDYLELLPDYRGEKDFYCIFREEAEDMEKEIVSLCGRRLPDRYGFHPIRDIQVLTPMRRGRVGAANLNAVLQEALNPGNPAMEKGGFRFRVGDKLMQIRNNYDKDVFNGDFGYVTGIDKEEETIGVEIDGRVVTYEPSEWNELVLAYSITVHKSQGSEFPCVIMPVHTSHYLLLQRNLLYTGVTRGKKLVVLVGSRKAIAMAIANNRVMARNTRLQGRLESW